MEKIKVLAISLIACLSLTICLSQNLQKPSPSEINSAPQWAKLMYADDPNVWMVEAAYKDYYKTELFEKNYHTQYYKRWKKKFGNQVDQTGKIVPPSPTSLAQQEIAFRKKQNQEKVSNWSVIGPYLSHAEAGNMGSDQTNVYSIDQCINQPNYLYLGTEPGEVYKSIDQGNSWALSSKNEDFGSGVTAIEVDPNNPQIVFCGANKGVFRSIDGGLTWINVLNQSNFGANEILIYPNNQNLVWVASDKGLFHSADGGTTWITLFQQKTYDIKIHPTDPNIIYLLKNNPSLIKCEFLRSNDIGATWQVVGTNWYSSNDPARYDGGARLAVTPLQPNRVYAYLIGDSKPDDYGYIGVYRSDDSGSSWQLPNGPVGGPYSTQHVNLAIGWATWTYHQGFYNCAIAVSPTNADEILIGGLNLYKSTDAGATFSSVSGYVGGPLGLHVDMQDFRVIGNNTWVTSDGGAYLSNDFFGSDYEFKMNGVHGSDFWGFGSGWNEDVLVGGLYHNGNLAYHENYPSGQFLQMGGGEAPTGYVNPGQNRKTYYSDVAGKIIPLQLNGAIVNAAFGLSPNESYYPAESSELEFHPNCYSVAYLGKDNSIWKTSDGGASFTLLHTFGTNENNQIKYIEVSSSNPNVIYCNQQPTSGSNGTLWKTTDGGNLWSQMNKPAGNSRRMLLSINPINENELWIAYPDGSNGFKVFKTSNSGTSWQNLSSSLLNDESVQSIAHVAGTNGGIYIATNKAVYYRNNTTGFVIDNSGLPLFTNGNILRPFYRDGKIRLATYGKGIWESNMNEAPSLPIARAMVDKMTQQVVCGIDSFYFEDHSFINHQGASWSWTFPTGSPNSSVLRNPSVYFSEEGDHIGILQITDNNGNASVDTVTVSLQFLSLPTDIQEGFQNSFPPDGWISESESGSQWSLSSTVGGFGTSTQSAIFDNYNNDSQGDSDDLIVTINPMYLSQDPTVNFDVAYARWGSGYSDTLQVLVSTDCGETYTPLYEKGGTDLSTSPDFQQFFTPSNSQWRTDSVDLSNYQNETQLQVVFRNIGRYGNCLYLDNINLNGVALVTEQGGFNFKMYPNPIKKGAILNWNYGNEKPLRCLVIDAGGKQVLNKQLSINELLIPENLKEGTYFIQVIYKDAIFNEVLVIID